MTQVSKVVTTSKDLLNTSDEVNDAILVETHCHKSLFVQNNKSPFVDLLELVENENRFLVAKMKEIDVDAKDIEKLNEENRYLKEENKQLAETNAEHLEAMKNKDCKILDLTVKLKLKTLMNELWSGPMMKKKKEQRKERRRKLEKNSRIYEKRNSKLNEKVCDLKSELRRICCEASICGKYCL